MMKSIHSVMWCTHALALIAFFPALAFTVGVHLVIMLLQILNAFGPNAGKTWEDIVEEVEAEETLK